MAKGSQALRLCTLAVLLAAGCTTRSAARSVPDAGPTHGLGTLIVLGDSISAGMGGQPSYADGLQRELTATYGPLELHNLAVAGATTASLPAQLAALPDKLPGPVAVVITIGGNDMLGSATSILLGVDAAPRDQMAKRLAGVLADLTRPDRFGSGVTARVFVTNIYDFSDGAGDFKSCSGFMGLLPRRSSDPIFERWNRSLAAVVAASGQQLVELHALFRGHGRAASEGFYLDDCIHPNPAGHQQLGRAFLAAVRASFPTTQ